MLTLAIATVVFTSMAFGIVLGKFLRHTLPERHISQDAKDVVRLGTGLIGTIAALVLGLLIASAKAPFDVKSSQTNHLTANVILLDGLLA